MNWCLAMLACLGIVTGDILSVRKDDTIQKNQTPTSICETKECLRSAINFLSSMDTTADPCEDFYQYACGNWGKELLRPDNKTQVIDWFTIKLNQVDMLVRDFLSKNSSDHPRAVQQARDMYKACLNNKDELNKSGFKTIINVLETLGLPPLPTYNGNMDFDDSDFDSNTYNFDWLETVIKAKTYLGMDLLIGFDVTPDPLNTTRLIISVKSPEDTSTFKSTTKLFKYNFNTIAKINQREESKTKTSTSDDDVVQLFVTELFKSFGLNETDLNDKIKQIKNVYKTIEDDIKEIKINNSRSDGDIDPFENNYHTVAELQGLTDENIKQNIANPHPLIWRRYLEGMFNMSDVSIDVENMKILVCSMDLKYLTQMAAYTAKTPPGAMELFIWIEVLNKIMETTKQFTNSDCAGIVTNMMSMSVAYGVIDPHVLEIHKPQSEIMLNELKNALKHSISQAEWMDEITKQASYKKIAEMKTFIGYPEWLFMEGKLDEFYKGLEIQTDSHLDNVISVNRWRIKKLLNEMDTVIRGSWRSNDITPISVNAAYFSNENAINLPLFMLQYPFGDLGLFSLNYGKIGAILGHEITHGFDNQGRLFDENGNRLSRWSNESISSYENKAQCFVDQYSDYYFPEIDKHVNGYKTLNDNIADNGGIKLALAALKTHLRETGPEAILPGFKEYTSEQMFFLSFANLWCEVSTKESLTFILKDEHSPERFRVIGSLQNSPDFARAYKCKSGSKMNPEKKCILY